jgi:hypothetical protein
MGNEGLMTTSLPKDYEEQSNMKRYISKITKTLWMLIITSKPTSTSTTMRESIQRYTKPLLKSEIYGQKFF